MTNKFNFRNTCSVLILAMALLASCSTLVRAADPIIPDPGTVNKTGTSRVTQVQISDFLGNCGGDPDSACAVSDTLDTLLARVSSTIIRTGGGAIVLLIIFAGIRYAMARGDVKKITEARTAVIQLSLAVALIIGSTLIISIMWAVASALLNGASLSGQ